MLYFGSVWLGYFFIGLRIFYPSLLQCLDIALLFSPCDPHLHAEKIIDTMEEGQQLLTKTTEQMLLRVLKLYQHC